MIQRSGCIVQRKICRSSLVMFRGEQTATRSRRLYARLKIRSYLTIMRVDIIYGYATPGMQKILTTAIFSWRNPPLQKIHFPRCMSISCRAGNPFTDHHVCLLSTFRSGVRNLGPAWTFDMAQIRSCVTQVRTQHRVKTKLHDKQVRRRH